MNRTTLETPTSQLEAKLFRAFWDDGLLDLFFGVGVVAIGFSWALGLIPLGALVPVVLSLFWNPLRRAIVEPRVGLVEFAPARVAKGRRQLVGVFWIGVGALVLFVGLFGLARASDLGILRTFIAGVPAALIGVLAGLVAAGLKIARFLIYALVFAASGVAVALADLEPEVAILAGGGVVTIAGAAILSRFLRIAAEVEEAG